MLLVTIPTLCLLAFINYRVGGKMLFYPPVVFCGVWALDMSIAWVAQDFFYRLSPETSAVVLCGAVAFSIGCWVGVFLPEWNTKAKLASRESSDRIITVLFFVVIVGVPFFVRWVYGLVVSAGVVGPFLMLARAGVVSEEGHSLTFTLFGTLIELAGTVALIAFYEREQHRKRAVLAIAIALSMGIFIGQKVGPLSLLMGLIWLDWLKTRRLRWKLVLGLLLILITVAATLEFYVHLGGDSLEERATPILQNLALYASGGVVGLDRLLREPNSIPPSNPFYATYSRIVRRLGGHIDVPPQSRDFIAIGPRSLNNVYTMYGEYLFLGYFGAILLTAVIGLLVTLIYKRALQGGIIAIFLYSGLFTGVVFGAFTDYFLAVYLFSKLCLIVWLVYRLPVRWAQFKTMVRRSVNAELVKAQ